MLALPRRAVSILMWVPAFALILGFAGALHPIGDSFAVFRPVSLVALAILSLIIILLKARAKGILGLAFCAYCAISMLPPASPDPSNGQSITVYQKNLLFLISDTRSLEADIRAADPEIVTLQEVNDRNRALLDNLRDLYPTQHICRSTALGELAVLAKWPAIAPPMPCVREEGLAAVLIDTGRYRAWVIAAHMVWPWPHGQAAQLKRIESRLSLLEDPIIMAGDFNMVHWAQSLKSLARVAGIAPAGQAGATFTLPDLPVSLGIDHVFMPEGARARSIEKRPRFGSDHNGVLASFELP